MYQAAYIVLHVGMGLTFGTPVGGRGRGPYLVLHVCVYPTFVYLVLHVNVLTVFFYPTFTYIFPHLYTLCYSSVGVRYSKLLESLSLHYPTLYPSVGVCNHWCVDVVTQPTVSIYTLKKKEKKRKKSLPTCVFLCRQRTPLYTFLDVWVL